MPKLPRWTAAQAERELLRGGFQLQNLGQQFTPPMRLLSFPLFSQIIDRENSPGVRAER